MALPYLYNFANDGRIALQFARRKSRQHSQQSLSRRDSEEHAPSQGFYSLFIHLKRVKTDFSTTTAFGGIIKWANAGTVQNGYSLNTFANSLVTSYGGPSWVFAANYYSSQASASTAPSVANSTTSLGQMPAGFSTSIWKIDTVLARPVFVWASVTAS